MAKDASNRRRFYRINSRFGDSVRVELCAADGSFVPVTLIDVSAGGAGIMLPDEHGGFREGTDVLMRFHSDQRLGRPVEVNALVCHRKLAHNGNRLGLQFLEWTTDRKELDRHLKRLFNEREAFRVEPESTEPVEVRLGDGADTVVELRDISVHGLGLRYPHGQGKPPMMDERVALQIIVPTAPTQNIALTGVVVMRQVAVEGVFVGFRFEQTRSYQRVERLIRDYVMQRQVEILRRQRED